MNVTTTTTTANLHPPPRKVALDFSAIDLGMACFSHAGGEKVDNQENIWRFGGTLTMDAL
jgi:hypothetical protein